MSINGAFNGPNGHYPANEVNALQALCKASVPVEVVSRYLQNLDIHSLVIKAITFGQGAGDYSKQNFTLECTSDVPVELEIS